MTTIINYPEVIARFDKVLARGLSNGLGERGGQVCIEAALCEALGLPHGDDPKCVAESVRIYKIRLNDSCWSSSAARAAGLRDLGIAQLGSKDTVNDLEFTKRLAKKTIQQLIPALFRELFPGNVKLLACADKCEAEGSAASAKEAQAWAEAAAAEAAWAAAEAEEAEAAEAAAAEAAWAEAAAAAEAAASSAKNPDKYLLLSASLALEVLRELKSPGVEWLGR
jgi:hypothetical protein